VTLVLDDAFNQLICKF